MSYHEQPHSEPQWQQPLWHEPVYVPIYAHERAVPVGIAGVVLGIFAVGFVPLAFAASPLWLLPALLFSVIGTPVAAVALTRRVRRRMPFVVALVGLVMSGIPLALMALGLTVTAAS